MKTVSLVLLCATLLTLSPAYGQGRRSRVKPSGAAPAAAAAEEAPKTGVRFVICSPAGTTMPSPLYVQTGDDTFKAINIGARTPSMRVKPIGGVVKFWDKDPSAEAMGEDDKKKKPAAKAALCMSSLEKSLFKSFAYFSIGLIIFVVELRHSLYILD